MDIRFDRIEQRLDRIVEIQGEMQADIREHIRRTGLAEDNIAMLSENMKPVQEHVAFVRGLGRFTTWVVGIAAGVAAILALILNR